MCADENSEALLTAVRRQAEVEKQEILTQARQEVERVQAQADAEIERLRAEALSRTHKELLIEMDRLLGRARMDKSYLLLCAKRRLLQEAFEQAGQEILTLQNGNGYRRILEALIAEAVAAVGDNACLVTAESERNLCKAAAAQLGIACSVTPADHRPGTVVAISGDGHRRADNSLHTRLRKTGVLKKHEIAALLFGCRDHPGDAK